MALAHSFFFFVLNRIFDYLYHLMPFLLTFRYISFNLSGISTTTNSVSETIPFDWKCVFGSAIVLDCVPTCKLYDNVYVQNEPDNKDIMKWIDPHISTWMSYIVELKSNRFFIWERYTPEADTTKTEITKKKRKVETKTSHVYNTSLTAHVRSER